MASTITIILIAVIFILIPIILKRIISKTVFRILSIIWTVVGVAVLITGLWIYNDAADFQQNFAEQDNIFVLDIDGKIVAGFTLESGGAQETVKDISILNSQYSGGQFEQMKGDSYKLVIVKESAIKKFETTEFGGYEFTHEEYLEMLESDTPTRLFVYKVLTVENISFAVFDASVEQVLDQFGTDDYFRGLVFATAFSFSLEQETLIQEVRNRNILIYPETITFKLVRFIPESMLNKEVI